MTNPGSAYNRLLALKHRHYIDMRTDERGENPLWTLHRNGFRAIRDLLPSLREEGYLSEAPYHDWLTTAFHLGEWLVERPAGVELFTEQQLRRYEPEHYPAWVPQSEEHRPDGYWHRRLPSGTMTIALEMELSRKKSADYQKASLFYGDSAQINRVLWVVRTLGEAKSIGRELAKGLGARPKIHSFILLGSFLKHGWSAPVVHGAGSTMPPLTVERFLQKALEVEGNANAVPSQCHGTTTALFETRIKRIKLVTSGTRRGG